MSAQVRPRALTVPGVQADSSRAHVVRPSTKARSNGLLTAAGTSLESAGVDRPPVAVQRCVVLATVSIWAARILVIMPVWPPFPAHF